MDRFQKPKLLPALQFRLYQLCSDAEVKTVTTVRNKWISDIYSILTNFCECAVHQDLEYVKNIGPYIAPRLALNGYLWSCLIRRITSFA
jgi:hypothetical protein